MKTDSRPANDGPTDDAIIHYKLLAQALSNSDEWIMLESSTGKIRQITGAFKKITGYAPDDFISGKSDFRNIISKSDVSAYQKQETKNRKDGESYRMEFSIVTKTGRVKGIVQHAEQFYDAEGGPLGWITRNREVADDIRFLMKDICNRLELEILVGKVIFDDAGNPTGWETMTQNNRNLHGDNSHVDSSGENMLDTWLKSNPKWKERLYKVAQTGQPFICDFHNQQAKKYYEISCFRIKPGRFAIILSDITNTRNQLNRLNKSEKLYYSIVEAQREIICRVKPDTTFVYANAACCRELNKKPEELVGTRFIDFVPEEAKETVKSHIRSFYQADTYKKLTLQLLLPGRKSPAWYEWTNSAIFDESGNLSEIQAVGYDITEQYKAELESLKTIKRFNIISEYSKTVYWEVDENGKYKYVSAGSRIIYGYYPHELVGKLHFYDLQSGEDREEYMNRALDVFKVQGTFENFIGRILTKCGEIKWISTSGLPIYDNKGVFRGYRGSDMDITLRKNQEDIISENMKMIEEYQAKLKRLNLALSESEENVKRDIAQFLHDEIGQVLSAMHIQVSFMETLSDESEREEIFKGFTGQLNKAIYQCREMTYELSPPSLKKYGLTEAIRHKLSEVDQHHKLSTRFVANFRVLEVDAKVKVQLYRMIIELINNVIKHADAAKLSVELALHNTDLKCVVEDNGKGFTYNYQKDLSSNKSFGLFSISERLAAFGGSMKVEPGKSKGARIVIDIPGLVSKNRGGRPSIQDQDEI